MVFTPEEHRPISGPTPDMQAKMLCYNLMEWTNVALALKPSPEEDDKAYEAMLALDIRKQTLFSLIDAAAMFRAIVDKPKVVPTESNGVQWRGFVRDHCNWPGAERVSVPVLLKRIEHRLLDPKKSGFPPLNVPAVRNLVEHLPAINHRFVDLGREVRSSEMDPMLEDLRPFMTIGPIEKLVEETTLVCLLYSLRNSRIHTMRNQGDAVERWATISEPSYQASQQSRNYVLGAVELHLMFTEAFVALLLRAGVASLRAFLLAKGVDPFKLVRDSSAWELKPWTPFRK